VINSTVENESRPACSCHSRAGGKLVLKIDTELDLI